MEKKPPRYIAYVTVCLLAAVVVVVALLPTIFSSAWGRELLTDFVSNRIRGQVEVNELSLSWFGPQRGRVIALYDPDGNLVGTASEITCYRSLVALIWSPSSVGRVEILSPDIKLEIDEDGRSNFDNAMAPRQGAIASSAGLAADPAVRARGQTHGTFVVKGGQATVAIGGLPPTGLSAVDAELAWPKSPGFTLHFSSRAGSREQAGNIHLDASLTSEFVLRARFHRFPSTGLDGLASFFSARWARLPSALLGPSLDGSVHLHVDPDTLIVRSDLKSPHTTLKIAINTDEEGHLAQEETGHLAVTLPPQAVEALTRALSGGETITTTDSLSLNAKLGTFAGKLESGQLSTLSDLSFEATAQMAPLRLKHGRRGTVTLRGSDFKLGLQDLRSPVQLRSRVQAGHGEREGDLILDLRVHGLVSETGQLLPSEAALEGKVNGRGLPLGWVGLLSGLGDTLEELIGATLNFEADIDYRREDGHLSFAGKSEQLELPRTQFALGDGARLTEPVSLRYLLTPTAWRLLLGDETALRLKSSTALEINVKELEIPPGSLPRLKRDSRAGLINAQLMTPQLALESPSGTPLFSLTNLEIDVEGDHLSQMGLEAICELQFSDPDSWIARVAGRGNPVEAGAAVSLDRKWGLSFDRFHVRSKSPHLLTDFQGQYTGGILAIIAPVDIHYSPSKELAEQLGLKESPSLHFTVAPFAFKADPLRLNELQISSKFTATAIALAGEGEPVIHDLSGVVSINAPKNSATASLKLKASDAFQKDPGTAEAKVTLKTYVRDGAFDLAAAKADILVSTEKLPMSGHAWLGQLLGSQLTGKLQGSFAKLNPLSGSLSLAAESDLISLKSAVDLGDVIALSKGKGPSTLRWTVTPSAFNQLYHWLLDGHAEDSGPQLKQPADLALEITHLRWPVPGHAIAPTEVELEFEAEVETAVFEGTELNKLILAAEVEDLTRPSNIRLEGRVAGSNGFKSKGGFQLEGTIDRFLDDEGRPSIAELGSDLMLSLDQMPVRWLAQLAGLSDKNASDVEAVLGHTLDLHAAARLDRLYGPVTLQMQSPLCQMHVEAMVEEQAVTLRKPAYAQLAVTPATGRAFLEGVNPLLASSVRSERPVTLTIDSEGFRLPIQPLTLEGLRVEHGVISPGRIWITNQGPVQTLLSFFGATKMKTSRDILAWSTPLYFSMKDGIVSYGRMDMLLGNELQVASWGSVNLKTDELRLTLGIPGYSLRELLKIPSLPSQYYLLIPVKGTIQNPRLNESKISARIAAILAKRQGLQGEIVGSMLDILSGSKSDQRKVPPPTTQPFPWANPRGDS